MFLQVVFDPRFALIEWVDKRTIVLVFATCDNDTPLLCKSVGLLALYHLGERHTPIGTHEHSPVDGVEVVLMPDIAHGHDHPARLDVRQYGCAVQVQVCIVRCQLCAILRVYIVDQSEVVAVV